MGSLLCNARWAFSKIPKTAGPQREAAVRTVGYGRLRELPSSPMLWGERWKGREMFGGRRWVEGNTCSSYAGTLFVAVGAVLVPGNACCELEATSVAGLKDWELLWVGLQGTLDRIKGHKMSRFKSKARDISADARVRKTPRTCFSRASC